MLQLKVLRGIQPVIRRSVCRRPCRTASPLKPSTLSQQNFFHADSRRSYSKTVPVCSLNRHAAAKYDGVPEDDARVIFDHAQQPQTPVR